MTDPTKTLKKAKDTLYFFDELMKEIEDIDVSLDTKKLFQSYVANTAICKSKSLTGENRKWFLRELKSRKIGNYVLDDTLSRKLKKMVLKMSLPFYVRFFL